MPMPDKTVCEKHYIQAKRRAAESALRASLKKAKRKSLGESDIYLESKNDDRPLANMKFDDYPLSASTKNNKEKVSKNKVQRSPETPIRSLSVHNSLKPNDDLQKDVAEFEENCKSHKTPPLSTMDSSRSRSQCSFDASAMTVRIREIPVLHKLQYLYCLLPSVLPVVKQIHHEQCSEVELEKKLRTDIDLFWAKLNADEQCAAIYVGYPSSIIIVTVRIARMIYAFIAVRSSESINVLR
ncbi:hypothetical protein GH714_025843 [Hevea brasiliensis]|uniref:WRC domain-containing protein n=1 Tax=Hevea brasiliensis TaxID=3981 RepID=A0A6A6M367_HEVBR|nr:hypothetical protein GH714_025843 [Hevea brasiliensis]